MKRAAGIALSVIVVLFDHQKSFRNHGDTRTLEHYPLLSRTISVCHERRSSTQREAGCRGAAGVPGTTGYCRVARLLTGCCWVRLPGCWGQGSRLCAQLAVESLQSVADRAE